MGKRSITDDEIALIKAMLARRMKNSDIQFFFNRPDRRVNSGRITGIANGSYSDSASIAAADDKTVDAFLASRGSPSGGAFAVTVPGPSSPQASGPLDPSVIEGMFACDGDGDGGGVWRFKSGESDEHECKSSFGFKHPSAWLRAIAALANNRGGYVLFGVHDKDGAKTDGQDKSYAVTSLQTSDFVNADPADFANRIRSALDPTPRVQIAHADIGGKTVGIIHVEQHPSRPVIATKQEGDIREGDIFFRYPGQSARIKYSDLRAILDSRDAVARQQVLPLVEKLLTLGPSRALVADLEAGTLDDGQRSITIDKQLIDQIAFIREGEFDEVEGAPTLRLVGEVKAVSADGEIASRGVVTDATLVRNFLRQSVLFEPREYIRYAVEASHADWLPLFYFASKANLGQAELLAFIEGLSGSAKRRTKFVQRASGEKTAFSAFLGAPAAMLAKLNAGDVPQPTDVKSASTICLAVCGLTSIAELDSAALLASVEACQTIAHSDPKGAAMSNVRRAACRLDELLFAPAPENAKG